MTGCSSDMMLAQLLDEQLNEVDHGSIVEHVQSCVRCQERLKELTSEASGVLGREPLDRMSTDSSLTIDQLHVGLAGLRTPDRVVCDRFAGRNDGRQSGRAGTSRRSTATRSWPSSVMAAWGSSTRHTSSV